MDTVLKAQIAKGLGDAISMLVGAVASRPKKHTAEETSEKPEQTTIYTKVEIEPTKPIKSSVLPEIDKPKYGNSDKDYRFECVLKHLGGANTLLREAYERAIDEGVGDGVAEKIMETLNEHSGMEADIEKMLDMPDVKSQAEKLLSGIRAFRRAAWDVGLTTGKGGTVQDVADARLWNNVLYQEAYSNVKAHPGKECIASGM